MSLLGGALLILLAIVYAFAAGIYASRRKCPHCGGVGVTTRTEPDGKLVGERRTTCDHCGKEV